MKRYRRAILISLALLIINACALPSLSLIQSSEVQPENMAETIAAETLRVIYTDIILSATPTYTLSSVSETSIATSTPTSTSTPTNTPVPPLTQAPPVTFIPSLTPIPTYPSNYTAQPTTKPTATKKPATATTSIPCHLAELEQNVSIPDGLILLSGTPFTKVWRIKNIGSCTWDTSYAFLLVEGDAMGGSAINLPKKVIPGASVDIAIDMVAPATAGSYEGAWAIRAGTKLFGYGPEANKPFMVSINVITTPALMTYNLAENFCDAKWAGNGGELPCPGKIGNTGGFVVFRDNPNTESGVQFKPSIWTHPALIASGYIYGFFPAVPIKTGDRFQAIVGCLADFPGCKVSFGLYYKELEEDEVLINKWNEVYDGSLTAIDIDLSSLNGKMISIILLVENKGDPMQATALWIDPIILR